MLFTFAQAWGDGEQGLAAPEESVREEGDNRLPRPALC